MPRAAENLHEDTAVLTRGVEIVIRKLVRFLIGKMSLVSLQELIRYVFVEEIENKLRTENPEKNIPLTQLALLSGLDTRTVTKIRNSKKFRTPFHEEATFLRDSAPGAAILDVWSSKPPYFQPKSGRPKKLAVSGDAPSFESLFEEFGKTRGVTYKSLLKRLIESGAVELDTKKDAVRLVTKSYLPSDARDKLGAMEMGFSAIGNMVETVTRNIAALDDGTERFYQRGVWTYRLNKRSKQVLRESLRELLEETDEKARIIIEQHEESFIGDDQVTAGISLFYFEETAH